MSMPAKMTRPASGATVPLAMPNSVVLPAPFGPMMPSASPSASARSSARATTTAPKRLEIFSKARMAGMQEYWSASDEAVCHLPHKHPLPLIPAKAGIQGRDLGPRFRGDERTARQAPQGGQTYDNSCSCPPTGISGAVLLVVMTRSKRSPLRCHCPATSGVLVTFLTGWPVHFTGPTIDL